MLYSRHRQRGSGSELGPTGRPCPDRQVILDWLEQITQRPNIIAVAIIGACFATVGTDALARRLRIAPALARWLLRCGYAAMWASVALFIVAGFLPPS